MTDDSRLSLTDIARTCASLADEHLHIYGMDDPCAVSAASSFHAVADALLRLPVSDHEAANA